MSFRNQVTFSMVASRERQHGDRVPKLGKYQTRVLPVAAIYGGNASGKTNFFKALSFAKALVVKGTQPDSLIPVEPFRLDAKVADQPSRFGFELLIDEIIYEFSFAVTRKAVLEEKLVTITSTSEKVLYHRRDGKPNFDDSLAKDQFLQFAFKGTRDNQLFLTNSVSQKVDNFRPVYDWFKDTLELVAPDSRFEPFEQFLDEGHPLYSTMNEMLPQLDTGIAHLGWRGDSVREHSAARATEDQAAGRCEGRHDRSPADRADQRTVRGDPQRWRADRQEAGNLSSEGGWHGSQVRDPSGVGRFAAGDRSAARVS
jgi:Predicted ATPases